MKKVLSAIMLTLAIMIIMSGSVKDKNQHHFDFSLSFGVDGKDRLSTFENTFRVDTVDGPKVISLTLSEEDLLQIEHKINAILNEDYDSLYLNSSIYVDPCTNCCLFVLQSNKEYSLLWSSKNMVPYTIVNNEVIVEDKYEEDYRKYTYLNDLVDFIQNIISKYPAVKNLPAHQMYM